MNFTYHPDSVRMLVLELGPEYFVEMVLPRDQGLYHDRLKQFMECNHGLLQSRIVELTPEFRVVLPERSDRGDLPTVQALLSDTVASDARESWHVAIQGPPDLIYDICLRLRDGDESAKNAIMCHATSEEMEPWNCCDRCDDYDPLRGGCRVVQDGFHGACSNCIYQGRQISCTLRDEEEYRPSNRRRGGIEGKKRGVRKEKDQGEQSSKKRRKAK